MAVDDKVVIGQTHADDDPEAVLVGYLLGVEALRAGKQAVMWLTKNGVLVATEGFAERISVPDAPSVAELHQEYVERGGRLFACPVCVRTHGLEDAEWTSEWMRSSRCSWTARTRVGRCRARVPLQEPRSISTTQGFVVPEGGLELATLPSRRAPAPGATPSAGADAGRAVEGLR